MSVEAPPQPAVSFEALYRDHRAVLYHALVLITQNRDIATEAVDRGYGSWYRRIRRSARHRAEVEVLSRGLRWAKRKLGSASVQGFRLPGPELHPAERDTVDRFAQLPWTQRAAVVTLLVLDWSSEEAAFVIGCDRTAAEAALAQALVTLGRGTEIATEDVTAALTAAATTTREPLSRYEAVRAESTTRRVATMVGAAVVTLVLIGGGVLAVTRPGAAPPATPATGAQTVAGVPLPEAAAGGDLEWTQIALPLREGEANAVAYGSGGFVLLAQEWSSAPGTRVFTSTDGVSWQLAGDLLVNQDGWVQQIQAVGDGYAAVGSVFDGRDGREQPVVWTSPDGSSWTRVDLPIETSVDIDGRTVDLYTWINSVSTTSQGVMVLANQGAEFDPEPLIRDLLADEFDSSGGWGYSAEGLEIYNDQGRIAKRVPWEDLDVDPELVRLMTGGRSILYTSVGGDEWQSRVLDVGQIGGGVGQIALGDGAAAAVTWGEFSQSLYSGPVDGEWTRADLPGLASVVGVATVDGKLVAIGSTSDGGGAAWLSTDGAAWERIDDPDLAGNFYQVLGAGGAVAVFGDASEPRSAVGPAVLDLPTGTLEITTSGQYTVRDEAGDVVLTVGAEDLEYEDADVRVVDPETGDVLSVVAQEEIDLAFELLFREFEGLGPAGPQEQFIVFSTDGREWSRIDLSDLGGQVYPSGIAFGADTIVMTGHHTGELGGFRGEGPPPAVIWVATAGT